ncbi:DMT family transporter [Neisseria sp. ZJ106]|uniref:DMT family transporter n=1 Tax=Neisseria lisongii TaxID=2912188 RepID=A0ABY7RJ46_9NEIS|nr:DMT family transporter [Neisseria lisongii]MCF7520936.1 DMT family transporter [Neisseria lisongii]WCL71261.1 DMT family transporter [Neisseria lisongii]
MNHCPTSPNRCGLIEMILAMTICGTIGLTVTLSGLPETQLIFFRCLFGALILGLLCWHQGIFSQTRYTPTFWIASLIGGTALLANWYFLFSAYAKTSVGIATTVYNTQPFMMVLICLFLFKEKITKSIVFWLLVSFGGLYLISSTQIHSGKPYSGYLTGIFEALAAAALYAVASVAAKFLKNYPPTLIAFYQMLLGVVIFLPFADFNLFTQTAPVSLSAAVTLGVVHTGLMYVFLYGAIQKLEAYKVASLSFLYPVLALLIDRCFFNIHLEPEQFFGVILILTGAAGINLKALFQHILTTRFIR